jgi:hypothetical protein
MTFIRMFSLATTYDVELDQMNVKETFLHGKLKEKVFMEKLEGFVLGGKKLCL